MVRLAAILIAASAASVAAGPASAGEAPACGFAFAKPCAEPASRGGSLRESSDSRVLSASSSDRPALARAAERAARAYLIRAGHIPPPGRMTRREVDVFLKAYAREHPYWHVSIGQYLQIAGKLEQGQIVAIKPPDMAEPEWIRRSGVALNVLSFIPIGRMASFVKSLSSRLGRAAPSGLPELRAEAQEAVARAVAMVGQGSGAAYGSRVHGALRLQILGSPNLRGEVSFLSRKEVKPGTQGSIRVDIVAYSGRLPAAIFDLKTGSARLTAARIVEIQRHLPRNMRNIPIEELRIR